MTPKDPSFGGDFLGHILAAPLLLGAFVYSRNSKKKSTKVFWKAGKVLGGGGPESSFQAFFFTPASEIKNKKSEKIRKSKHGVSEMISAWAQLR